MLTVWDDPAPGRPWSSRLRARAARTSSAVAASALIATFFYVRSQTKPTCCDAEAYLDAGRAIAQQGLFTNWPQSGLRTYLHPWLLSVAHDVAAPQGLSVEGLVFLAQMVLHIAACLVLHAALRRTWPIAARVSLPLLLCNPVLLAHVPATLTESLSISLTVFWLAALAALCRPKPLPRSLLLWASVGGLAGLAMMVRPANLVLAVATVVVLVGALGRAVAARERVRLLLVPGVVVLAFLVPLVPQQQLNSLLYGESTVFPVSDLGDFQLRAGVEMIKYATDVREREARPAPYRNPWLRPEAVPDQPLGYYVERPWDGARLLGLHVFNSLNPDYLFPYVHDRDPAYRSVLVVGSQLLVLVGLTGLAGLLTGAWRTRRTWNPLWPVHLALGALVLTSMALNALIAVETRFGVLTVVGLTLAAGHMIPMWSVWRRSRKVAWCGLALAWVASALWLTEWVLLQSPQLQQGL